MSSHRYEPESVGNILSELSISSATQPKIDPTPIEIPTRDLADASYHDFDLAEFPWAIFSRSDRPKDGGPILYSDEILHPETKQSFERRFETLAGPYGHATGTTYELAYILIQMYLEQGASDDKVVFGSLRNIARERGISPTGPNLKRIRRDLDILGSMSINSYNAFWNADHQAYETIRQWRFFGASTYFMPSPRFINQEELPFGFIEVTPTFQRIAKARGFFALGFPRDFFFALKPLEQRLAVFLARRFRFHSFVIRSVDDVAKTIPITGAYDFNQRKKLKEVADGLLAKNFPLLGGYDIRKKNGTWMVQFNRKQKPVPEAPMKAYQAEMSLSEDEEHMLTEIVQMTDDPGARYWWLHCLRILGDASIWRALGNFKELYVQDKQPIKKTKGAVFTGILQGIAKERNITLQKQ